MLQTFVDRTVPSAHDTSTRVPSLDSPSSRAWPLVLAAARHPVSATGVDGPLDAPAWYALGADGQLIRVSEGHPAAQLVRLPTREWRAAGSLDAATQSFIDLYAPLCGAGSGAPVVIGHLGQSLDGFIATHGGQSQWITGPENLLHMHRLRALCDAVVVGAGTVASDDPQLTTRLVSGPSPLRVVLDPGRRLREHYRVFQGDGPPTLYVCGRSRLKVAETRWGEAEVLGLDEENGRLNPSALIQELRTRGCGSIFVEGGGVTVSGFLAARVLDRLHITVAPLLIGEGRPAIRLPAPTTLSACDRPLTRVFRMGDDVLFDCDVRTMRPPMSSHGETPGPDAEHISRVR